ncbi:MAG: cbb3-type cytochrome c oxidase subunit 3 [Bdellovibrionaceae bacterium]|nr:cbb3-type cytochrome c oxidase subunit 3 [Pseudobdellovibrionaceae bacterium]
MKQEALKYFTNINLIAFAFFLFLITFIGIVFWTLRRSAKSQYEELGRAPLREEANRGK